MHNVVPVRNVRLYLIRVVAFTLFISFMLYQTEVSAASQTDDPPSRPSAKSAVFVQDVSYSMNRNGGMSTAGEIIHLYSQSAPEASIGYIAYQDTIIHSNAPAILSSDERTALLQRIADTKNTGFSNLIMGLEEGLRSISTSGTEKESKINRIILLSDGGIDYREGELTSEHLLKLEEVIKDAKNLGIRIDTVAIHTTNNVKLSRLEWIASETGGLYLNAGQLSDALHTSELLLSETGAGKSGPSLPFMLSLLAAAVIIGGAWAYVMTGKRSFNGSLEGVFLRTASGSRPAVKNWLLRGVRGYQHLTLQQLFHFLDVHESLPEASDIRIRPGRNGSLKITGARRCVLIKNGKVLPRGRTVTLHNREQLYITFEDGRTELVLTYKSFIVPLPSVSKEYNLQDSEDHIEEQANKPA